MAGIKNTEQYPWLCSTTGRLESPLSDGNNIVCSNEQDTADEVVQDAYEKYGIKCVYYRVTEDLVRDKVFNEDQLRYVLRAWYFNGYVEQLPPNVRSYQLQGIWGEDVVRMFASIGAFNYYSTYGGYDRNTPGVYDVQEPSIGDIVYIPANDTFYRVVDVKYYEQAFGLKPHTYTLTLRVYRDNKWTVSADSPTISSPSDPIYQVASYPLSSYTQFDDPLKTNAVVSEDARWSADPYNNVNVLYDENARARNQLVQLQRDIEEESRRIAAEIAAVRTSAGITEEEAKRYIGKVEDYKEDNDQKVEHLEIDLTEAKAKTVEVSGDGKTFESLDGITTTGYWTKPSGDISP